MFNAIFLFVLVIGLVALVAILVDLNTVPKPSVKVQEKTLPQKCAICGDGGWEFRCRCGVSYHRECWNYLNKCATLGCKITQSDVRKRIATRAYYLYCENGCQHGRDQQHWLEAERKVLSGVLYG